MLGKEMQFPNRIRSTQLTTAKDPSAKKEWKRNSLKYYCIRRSYQMLTFIDKMYEFSVLNSFPNKHSGDCVVPKPLCPDHGQTAAVDVREQRALFLPLPARPLLLQHPPFSSAFTAFISAQVLLLQIIRIRRCSTMPFTLCTFQPLIN